MTEPHLSAGVTLAAAAAGASLTAAAEAAAIAVFGIPLSAVTAAATGALVPLLLVDPPPLRTALRQWAGSLAFALVLTAIVLLAADLNAKFTTGVAGLLAMFARDLFHAARGELPPLITAVRERLAGRARGGSQ